MAMNVLATIKEDAKRILKERILRHQIEIDLKHRDKIYKDLEEILMLLSRKYRISAEEEQEVNNLRENILKEVFGFGIIDDLMREEGVTDILVNSPSQIYVERKGLLEKVDLKFENKEEIIYLIERMILETGRRIDLSSPFVDFRIEGGIRVTAVIPPVSAATPLFCIRKVLQDNLTFEHLKRFGSLDQKLLDFIRYCTKARLNILVSGSTGAGKTTLANLMLKEFVPRDERVVIIEDTEEITAQEPMHFIKLITRPPNIEGKGEITLLDLVKLALHLRPDRIVIGEIRGSEAFYFLHALNTGHEGSICTIHANNTEDALNRLEALSLMDRPNIQPNVIRRFLKLGIDLIIHLARLPGGKRIITSVSDFECDKDNYIIKDIFSSEKVLKDGKEAYQTKLTGYTPSFIDKLKAATDIPADFFSKK